MNEPLDPQAQRIMSESYPSDSQLLWATNYMLEAYDRHCLRMARSHLDPAPITAWIQTIIVMWEKPNHG